MKKVNEKGFTLAELLIVVAIIAVLVAVAIPVFGDQLEKARQSTDVANLRDAYAVARLAELENKVNDEAIKDTKNSKQDEVTYYFNAGTGKLTRYNADDPDTTKAEAAIKAARDNGTKMRAQTKVLKIDANESIFYKYYTTSGTRETSGPVDSVMKYQMTVDPSKAILKVVFQETGKDTFDFLLHSVTFVDPAAGSWDEISTTASIATNVGTTEYASGSTVTPAAALAKPSDAYGEVVYEKKSGPNWLDVNSTDGTMTTNADLTFADNKTETVIITATDDNGKTQKYTVTITVNISEN